MKEKYEKILVIILFFILKILYSKCMRENSIFSDFLKKMFIKEQSRFMKKEKCINCRMKGLQKKL